VDLGSGTRRGPRPPWPSDAAPRCSRRRVATGSRNRSLPRRVGPEAEAEAEAEARWCRGALPVNRATGRPGGAARPPGLARAARQRPERHGRRRKGPRTALPGWPGSARREVITVTAERNRDNEELTVRW